MLYTSNDDFWKPIVEKSEISHFAMLLSNVEYQLYNGTKKQKGDALEDLMTQLYKRFPSITQVKHDLHTSDNQIDHEIIFGNFGLPQFIQDNVGKSFLSECKNHQNSLSSREVDNLDGLLSSHDLRFGVFASYKSFSKGLDGSNWKNAEGKRRKLALISSFKRTIVGIDFQDLKNIVFKRANLLTILENKRASLINEGAQHEDDIELSHQEYLFNLLKELRLNEIMTHQETKQYQEKIRLKYPEE